MPHRLAKPWTLERPPTLTVCQGRNLLNNVLKDQCDGRELVPPNARINPGNPAAIEAPNEAFRAIDRLGVQWVECPAEIRKRVGHLAGRCAFDLRCANAENPSG